MLILLCETKQADSILFGTVLLKHCQLQLIPVWLPKISQARVAAFVLDQRSCCALAMVLIRRIIEQHYLLCLRVIFAFRIWSTVSYLGECGLFYNSGYPGVDFKRLNFRFHYRTFGHLRHITTQLWRDYNAVTQQQCSEQHFLSSQLP